MCSLHTKRKTIWCEAPTQGELRFATCTRFIKNEETGKDTINNREPGGSQDPDLGKRKFNGTVSTKMLGIVKFYKIDKGYGFIMPADNTCDIYVHHTGIAKESPDKTRRGLNKFEMVEFSVLD